MDAIDFDRTKFERVIAAFTTIATSLKLSKFTAVPISALKGDGVVAHTANTSWFGGPSLLEALEAIELTPNGDRQSGDSTGSERAAHIAVQYVTRDAEDDHRRWIMGDVADAALHVGDSIRVFPSGASAVVAAINTPRGSASVAHVGEAVAIGLDRQVDVARGDWIISESRANNGGDVVGVNRVTATLAWLDNAPLAPGRRLLARHGTRWLPARVSRVTRRLDLQSAHWIEQSDGADASHGVVNANDIVEATIEFASALPVADYATSAIRGAIVLVDPGTHATAAAAMIN